MRHDDHTEATTYYWYVDSLFCPCTFLLKSNLSVARSHLLNQAQQIAIYAFG